MNDNVTATNNGAAPRTPRLMPDTHMQRLIDGGHATPLSHQQRHRMFVRYGNTWWILGSHGWCEITGTEEIRKLDTWRRRLTEGSLWI